MKILFVAAEGAPFAKTGGLGDVIGALPKSLVKNGHEVAVILPYYDVVRLNLAIRLKTLASSIQMLVGVVNMSASRKSFAMV